MRFERRSGRVVKLDARGHALVFEDDSRLGYDKLLLAVGSKGRTAPWPDAEGEGLHYFVTLRDPLEWVLKHLADARFDEELSPRFRVHTRHGAVS